MHDAAVLRVIAEQRLQLEAQGRRIAQLEADLAAAQAPPTRKPRASAQANGKPRS